MTWIGRSKGTVAGAIAGLLVLSGALSAWAQAPKADRPTYAVGDKWIRSDGAYDLIRIESGRYVFAADGGREVHLSRDLTVAKIVRAGQVLLELEPPPALTWPLEVGQSGVSWLTLKSLDPQFGQSVVRLTWKVSPSTTVTEFELSLAMKTRERGASSASFICRSAQPATRPSERATAIPRMGLLLNFGWEAPPTLVQEPRRVKSRSLTALRRWA